MEQRETLADKAMDKLNQFVRRLAVPRSETRTIGSADRSVLQLRERLHELGHSEAGPTRPDVILGPADRALIALRVPLTMRHMVAELLDGLHRGTPVASEQHARAATQWLNTPGREEEFVQLLNHPDEQVAAAACTILAEIGTARAAAPLREVLEVTHPENPLHRAGFEALYSVTCRNQPATKRPR